MRGTSPRPDVRSPSQTRTDMKPPAEDQRVIDSGLSPANRPSRNNQLNGRVLSETFEAFSPVTQALLAGLLTWALTAVGAASVYLVTDVSDRLVATMFGFAAGVMMAASFWSLLAPSIELAQEQGTPGWMPAAVGFGAGGLLIRLVDSVLPHLHPRRGLREGRDASWRRTTLLVSAITLHNVPEGLAIGVAFGAAASAELSTSATLGGAVALALGIAIQNFPEGIAVSVPLRGAGLRPRRAFWYGQLSGAVEPPSAVLGALAVLSIRPLLPYALAFAAGAMIFVVIEELIPESQAEVRHHDLATLGAMGGFTVMMMLDVSLG